MTPGRHLSARKRELGENIQILYRAGWSTADIGAVLGYSVQQIRNIIRDRDLVPPSLDERIANLPAQDRRRIVLWRQLFCQAQTFTA